MPCLNMAYLMHTWGPTVCISKCLAIVKTSTKQSTRAMLPAVWSRAALSESLLLAEPPAPAQAGTGGIAHPMQSQLP